MHCHLRTMVRLQHSLFCYQRNVRGGSKVKCSSTCPKVAQELISYLSPLPCMDYLHVYFVSKIYSHILCCIKRGQHTSAFKTFIAFTFTIHRHHNQTPCRARGGFTQARGTEIIITIMILESHDHMPGKLMAIFNSIASLFVSLGEQSSIIKKNVAWQ